MSATRFYVDRDQASGLYFVVDRATGAVRTDDTESAAEAELWARQLERDHPRMSDEGGADR